MDMPLVLVWSSSLTLIADVLRHSTRRVRGLAFLLLFNCILAIDPPYTGSRIHLPDRAHQSVPLALWSCFPSKAQQELSEKDVVIDAEPDDLVDGADPRMLSLGLDLW